MRFTIPQIRLIVLCMSLLQVTTWASPFVTNSKSLARGGGGETFSGAATSPTTRPSWIDMDPETLQTYLEIARERHAMDVRKAEENYWSGSSNNEEKSIPEQLPSMDTYGIVPPTGWKIPDFSQDLDTSRMIFVTHGHDTPTTDTTTNVETPLFSKHECNEVIQNAEEHFQQHNGGVWTTLPSGQYDVAGFWIHSVPAVHEWFNRVLREKLFPLVKQQFPDFVDSVENLVVDNAYVFKYTTETGQRTGVHTDSGCLSFTIALNDCAEYSGGGTWFQGLTMTNSNGTIRMNQGHVTVRPGGVRHCGHAVTSGTRYIIGGFCMHRHKVEYARMLIDLGNERLRKLGDVQGAAEALEAAICVNPNFDGSYSNLANVYEELGDKTKAQQALEHCLKYVNPYCGEVAYSLAVMYLDQKQVDKAQECAEICLQLDDCDADAMNVMVQLCALRGDKQGEEAWSKRMVEAPGVSDELAALAYANLGVLHQGQDEEAVFYQKALKLNPKSFTARYSLACALAERKEWKEAVESFRMAVELARETDCPELSDALRNLYRAAIGVVQEEAQRGELKSQQAMGERVQEVMGNDNYAQLAASAGK